jgi:hypothetical protein
MRYQASPDRVWRKRRGVGAQVVVKAMSLRSRAGRSTRPSSMPWRLTVAWIGLLLSACSPSASASLAPVPAGLGLAAASSGVCEAIGALPDLAAARQAFTNVAHDALHGLAADPRLGRAMSARLLETMEKVETDLSRSADVAVLSGDLAELHASADAALSALGATVPACAG